MEDDDTTLSSHALAALQEFRNEQEVEKERFAIMQSQAQARFSGATSAHTDQIETRQPLPDIDAFKEDWQLSQFWYTSDTADSLAQELMTSASGVPNTALRIGVLCAPSVYPKLIARKAKDAWLFEFDTRFEVLAGSKFVKYDYNHPLQLDPSLKGTFDRLIIDPPFLSDECEVKAATTARWLGKTDARLLVCSGAKMRDLLIRLYKGRESRFKVEHQNGRLSNDFLCLLNYTTHNKDKFGFLTPVDSFSSSE